MSVELNINVSSSSECRMWIREDIDTRVHKMLTLPGKYCRKTRNLLSPSGIEPSTRDLKSDALPPSQREILLAHVSTSARYLQPLLLRLKKYGACSDGKHIRICIQSTCPTGGRTNDIFLFNAIYRSMEGFTFLWTDQYSPVDWNIFEYEHPHLLIFGTRDFVAIYITLLETFIEQ